MEKPDTVQVFVEQGQKEAQQTQPVLLPLLK